MSSLPHQMNGALRLALVEFAVTFAWNFVGNFLFALCAEPSLWRTSGWICTNLDVTGQLCVPDATILQRFLPLMSVAMLLFFDVLGMVSLGARLNPAFVLAERLLGRLGKMQFGALIVAQIAAHALALSLVQWFVRSRLGWSFSLQPPVPTSEISLLHAMTVEAALTTMIVYALIMLPTFVTQPRIRPLLVPVVISGLIYAGWDWTGASMNPAMYVGLAFASRVALVHPEVYILGPLIGACVAALAIYGTEKLRAGAAKVTKSA